ncbi:hypothetical protein MKW98_007740, partial [Papaver atlanticum]
ANHRFDALEARISTLESLKLHKKESAQGKYKETMRLIDPMEKRGLWQSRCWSVRYSTNLFSLFR